MSLLHTWLVLGLLVSAPLIAQADVYKCVDAENRITYTNTKSTAKGCTILTRDQPQTSRRSSASTTDNDASFPRVDSATQQSRDSSRRSILERELATEEKQLEEARRESLRSYAGTPGGKPDDSKVQLHERNIDALKKEISKLK